MFKLVLEMAEEPEIKLPASAGLSKEQESSRKTSTSDLLTIPKPLTVWVTINCGKFFKRWEYHTTWPASWEIYAGQEATVRTEHGTTDWFQIGKGVCQGCILSPCLFNLYAEYIMSNAYLTCMQSTSWAMLGWKKHKLESRLPGEISITSDMQMTESEEWRGTEEPLEESERGEWKSWLKAQDSENEDHGIWSHHFMGNRWRNSENSVRLHFGGLQNHCRWWLQPWN